MDHLIGQRFNLISKSEIRYVGTLHEINPEQSTIALEDVYSFGTEDRNPDNFIPPSQQKFDYIVFRGSDVKDIKIVDDQKENKQPSPPSVPDDPAILNASRPGPSQGPPQDTRGQSPFPPPGYPRQPQFGDYPPPPHYQYGRGFGPPGGFGPGPQFYPGPPPPGYFGGPGQPGFPPGPGPFPQSHAPIGPPGQRGPGAPTQQPPQQQPSPQSNQKQTSELPDNKAPPTKQPTTIPPTDQTAPVPPSMPVPGVTEAHVPTPPSVPAAAKSQKMAPAVPFAVNQKSFTPPVAPDGMSAANGNKSSTPKPVPTQTAMEEASRQAKEAVAAAMAKLNPQANRQPTAAPTMTGIENLTRKVGEMSTNEAATQQPHQRGRGAYRGGRGNRSNSGGQRGKIEIPKADYDFESANAKFNKEDLIKEAIATGSPVAETPESNPVDGNDEATELHRKDSYPMPAVQAYNKSTSFFDNISSEAREREEAGDPRSQARALRGQEFKKNMETFGQGNVDGGYRGRGRGYRGRGRGYGGYRGYRGRGRGSNEATQPAQ